MLTETCYFQFDQKCSGKWIIRITHHIFIHSIFCNICVWVCVWRGGGCSCSAVCCVCTSPPVFPKSRRQKWETVEKYDQRLPVMCAWNPRRLSKLLARKRWPGNHGNGRSSHAEGGSEPARWGSYWLFDGHHRGFMRKTVTRPLCCAWRSASVGMSSSQWWWQWHLWPEGAFFFQLISCEGEVDRNQHQTLVHTADRDTDIDAAW